MLQIPGLYIQYDEATGRGVYTSQEISNHDIIEVCPVILIPKKDIEKIHQTVLHDYYFLWGTNHEEAVIALGYGSLYNHKITANAKVVLDFENNELIIQATQKIELGNQIYINYNDGGSKKIDLWFDAK